MLMGTGNPLLLTSTPSPAAAPEPTPSPVVSGQWIATATGGVWAEAPPATSACRYCVAWRGKRGGARCRSGCVEGQPAPLVPCSLPPSPPLLQLPHADSDGVWQSPPPPAGVWVPTANNGAGYV